MAEDTRLLRVLHVMDSLGEGGAEQNLLTLVEQLQSSIEHHVAWLYDDETMLERFQPFIATRTALRAGRGVRLLGATLRLAALIRKVRPDVVHAKLIRASLVARVAARMAGVPIVTTWECVSYNARMYHELGARGPALRTLTQALDAATGIFDRRFIAVTREVAEYNAKKLWIRPERVTVIYNAVAPSRLVRPGDGELRDLRAKLGIEVRSPVLLSVGRLVDQKAHDTSIRAIAKVRRRYPGVVLLIAGGGPMEGDLKELIRAEHVQDSVRLLGPRRDVPALLHLADIFLFASHYEGFGIALIEAMAAGLPAIASRIPTSIEIAGNEDSVRWFQSGDVTAIADAVLDVAADLDLWRTRAVRNAGRICERFSAEKMCRAFLEVASAGARRR